MKLKSKYLVIVNILLLLNFAARFKQAKLATKNDIADFVQQTDFDKKLISINKKIILNKTRHIEAEKKLNEQLTSYAKLINDLTQEIKLI